jgi:hypothetical protein
MSDLDLLRRLGEDIVPPPLDALRETARRRGRRAATAAVVAVAVVAAIVFGAVQLAVNENRSTEPTDELPTDTSRPLTYAEGATLHVGEKAVTMSAAVAEIDLVDGAAVVRTDDGGIWLTDGGAPEQIGTLGAPAPAFGPKLPPFDSVSFVVSNNTGPLAAWLEFPEPDQPELVAYDTATGEETARQPIDVKAGSGVVLTFVDDRYAYWDVDPQPFDDPAGVGRTDLATGEQIMDTKAAEGPDPLPVGPPRTILVSHREGGGPPYEVDDGIRQQFTTMPGGHFEPAGEQPLEVLDGATGTPFVFGAPSAYPARQVASWVTQWVDDDTFVMAAYRLDPDSVDLGPADLLTCQVATRACETTVPTVDGVLPAIG